MGSKGELKRSPPPLEEVEYCPYLKRSEGDQYPVQGFCMAYRDGRLRVPSIWEFRTLCTCRRHVCCETYLHRLREEQGNLQRSA